ncbi:MAG: trigger factor [Dehalococcoidia bacterium]
MKITKEDLPQREVQLNIEVEEEDLEPYMEQAYRKRVQRVNIPGFRKGKAPRAIMERFIGREALQEDAVDLLVPKMVEQAVTKEEIEQGGVPSVEVVQEKPEDPLVLKATVPLMPEVTLDAYRDIRVQKEAVEVDEEQVVKILEQLRWDVAPWEPVERAVALKDQVTMDLRAEVGGREVAKQKGVEYFAAEDNPNPVPGFVGKLVGIEPGEAKEFTILVPGDHEDRTLAGQECKFNVTVQQVREKLLGELNDEFAKGVGEGYDSLDALRDNIRDDIRNRQEMVVRRKHEQSIVEELVTRTSIEMSPLLVEHEIEHLLADEQSALKRQQVGMEQYLQMVGKSEEEHREEVRTAALTGLTRVHAIRKVGELEGLTATSEEVDEEIKTMLEQAGPQAAALKRNLDSPNGRDSMMQTILSRKIIDRLVVIANGEESGSTVPVLQGPDEESTPGGTEDAGKS